MIEEFKLSDATRNAFLDVRRSAFRKAAALAWLEGVILNNHKKFIKKLKEAIDKTNSTNPDRNAITTKGSVLKVIDKLAGSELIDNHSPQDTVGCPEKNSLGRVSNTLKDKEPSGTLSWKGGSDDVCEKGENE